MLENNQLLQKYNLSINKRALEPALIDDLKRDVYSSRVINKQTRKDLLGYVDTNQQMEKVVDEGKQKVEKETKVVDDLTQ